VKREPQRTHPSTLRDRFPHWLINHRQPWPERAISCVQLGKQGATNPLGDGLVVLSCSFGQSLSFSLCEPDGHDLALGFTPRQLRSSGFALHKRVLPINYCITKIVNFVSHRRIVEPAATAFAVAAFTGARRGEVRGPILGELPGRRNPHYAISVAQPFVGAEDAQEQGCNSSHCPACKAAGVLPSENGKSNIGTNFPQRSRETNGPE